MRIVVNGQQAFSKAVLEALLERGENVVAGRLGDLDRVVDLKGLAVARRPGARPRVGAADEVVDLADRLLPVDAHVVLRAPALVGGPGLVLRDPWRLPLSHELDALEDGIDAQREKPARRS